MHCELTAEGKSGWRAEEQVTDALELKREPPRITNLAVSSRVARSLPKLQQCLPPERRRGDSRWLPDVLQPRAVNVTAAVMLNGTCLNYGPYRDNTGTPPLLPPVTY